MMTDVIEALVRYVQNQLAQETPGTDDKTLAISCAALFREWKPGAYKAGDIRTKDGVPYECMTGHDSTVNADWTVDVRTLWKPYHSRKAEWALPFIHPTGAHDCYQSGEYCIYNGQVYRSKVDNNAYSPDEYAGNWEAEE